MLERKATLKNFGTSYSEKISLTGLLNKIFKEPAPIAHERKNRKELRKLLKLEKHQLADIGLSKSDVAYVLSLPLTKSAAKELNYARRRSSKI